VLAQSSDAAFWLMLAALPVAAWVVLSDLRAMRIPNLAVLALLVIYALVGAATLPFATWAWAWVHFVVILAIGFVLSMTGGFGAGDAKFAAAMAPFVALGDARLSSRSSRRWPSPATSPIAWRDAWRCFVPRRPNGSAGSARNSRWAWRWGRR